MILSVPIPSTEIYISLCNIMDPGFYPRRDPPGAEATKGGCHIRLLDNLGQAQIFPFTSFSYFSRRDFFLQANLLKVKSDAMMKEKPKL